MSYDQDPARWSTDPDEAPELLRGAFSAGRNEGPSRNQMRSLAVKLAAASAGGAVAVGTVKAASAGNTLTTVATWSAAKMASVVVLAGSVVTGAVIWSKSSPDAPSERTRAPMQAPVRSDDPSADPQAAEEVAQPQAVQSAQQQPGAPAVAPSVAGQPAAPGVVVTPAGGAAEVAPIAAPVVSVEALPQAKSAQQPGSADTSRGAGETAAVRSAAPAASTSVAQRKPAERTSSVNNSARSSSARTARVASTSSAELPPPSEVTLLRNAQVALQSRPREAFQLTQQHRRLYPAGEFAQERDALAIQALMRAGETDQARELAQAFIRAYPTSPHAHRFREAMGIR